MGDAGGARRDGDRRADQLSHRRRVRDRCRRRGFDFIISSQFTHHLTDGQIVMFIRWMEAHARRGWFIGDLHRHWLPYYGFGLLAWLARWHHFVLSDGRISIARGFVPRGLASADARRGLDATAMSRSPGICRSGSASRGIVRTADHRRRAGRRRRRHRAGARWPCRDADRAQSEPSRQGVRRFPQRRGDAMVATAAVSICRAGAARSLRSAWCIGNRSATTRLPFAALRPDAPRAGRGAAADRRRPAARRCCAAIGTRDRAGPRDPCC